MDSTRFPFTQARLAAVEPPATGKLRVWDTKARWLALVVRPTGAKTFAVIRKVEGRVKIHVLGPFPGLTVDQAREAASPAAAAMLDGPTAAAKKRAAKAETTLQALFTRYLAEHALPHKKSAQGDEDQFDRYLASMATKRLSTITHDAVRRLHTRVGEDHGPYAANRLLALLSSVFNFAARSGYVGVNPTKGVKRFREQSRERFIGGDELPKFLEAVEAEPQTFRDFFMLLLLCGARRGNVQAMRWEDMNLERAVWTVPASKSKSGKPLTIYLPAPAVEIIKARHLAAVEAAAKAKAKGDTAKAEVSPYVFPARRSTAKVPHLREPKTAWKRVLDRAGLKDLRVHDLRRTLGSWAAATGASLPVIGKTLGHANQATTAIYARLNLDPVRGAVDVATAAMLATTQIPANATPTAPAEPVEETRPDGWDEAPAF
ncbi:MAG: tyrosine-type recombinase/integrase [Planctomycetota bacterium]|nr:tyrosine-type recombinase/integrase [Planctomycetota bacterium]